MKHIYDYPSLLVFAFSLLLLIPAVYNGYPLVYSDTGTYIYSGFESVVPTDRPITYGLFIRHSSLAASLWFTILAQALIVSYTVYKLLAFLIAERTFRNIVFCYSAIILCMFSSLAWYTSFLMADIFTSVSFIFLLLLLLKENISKGELFIFVPAYLFLSSTHLSNGVTTILFLIILLLLRSLFNSLLKVIRFKRIFYALFLSIGTFFFLASIQYSMGGGFVISRSSNVFFTGKMVENGILKVYLNNECGKKALKLCRFKDSLPNSSPEFLWNQNSPLNLLGGWTSNAEECQQIKYDILTTPKYLTLFFKEAIKSSIKQITLNDFGEEFLPFPISSAPYFSVKSYFKPELKNYLNSRQNNIGYEAKFFKGLSYANNILIIISLSFLIFLIFFSNISLNFKLVSLLTMLYYLCNTSAAAINTFSARYCSRFSWLFIFLALIGFIIQIVKSDRKYN